MENQLNKMIADRLERLDSKLDSLIEKVNTYTLDCSTERISFDARIKGLESSINFAKGKLFLIAEKLLIWGLAAYFGGKELMAHF